jgi:hypothetical protein
MPAPTARSPRQRDADNELYDRGCDLAEAAAAIRRVAGSPSAAAAVPALLGCIETALRDLTSASVALQRTTAETIQTCGPTGADRKLQGVTDRMERGFTNLYSALSDAEAASQAARSLAARTIAAADAQRDRVSR